MDWEAILNRMRTVALSSGLTRKDLDGQGCGTPGCTHPHPDGIFLRARCCTGPSSWSVRYVQGRIALDCSRCGKPGPWIKVAAE